MKVAALVILVVLGVIATAAIVAVAIFRPAPPRYLCHTQPRLQSAPGIATPWYEVDTYESLTPCPAVPIP